MRLESGIPSYTIMIHDIQLIPVRRNNYKKNVDANSHLR